MRILLYHRHLFIVVIFFCRSFDAPNHLYCRSSFALVGYRVGGEQGLTAL